MVNSFDATALDIQTFVAKPPVIEAVRLTLENVEDVAKWMESDSYSVEKDLKGGRPTVKFFKRTTDTTGRDRRTEIGMAMVDQYLVKYPPHITERLQEVGVRFWTAEESDIQKFVNQSRDGGVVTFDLTFYPPYDR